MSMLERARIARLAKTDKYRLQSSKAFKARKRKVSNLVSHNQYALTMANQSKTIKHLEAQITVLKAQINKLRQKCTNNVSNQSSTDKLHQIMLDINQIMHDMNVTTQGKSYDR